MSPRVLVLLVALLNLATGLGFGVALGRASVARHDVAVPAPDVDLVRLADVLDLPAEKAAKVRAILASCRPRCDVVMDEIRPRMRALHEQFLAELGAELTPAQMDRLVAEYHRQAGTDIHQRR